MTTVRGFGLVPERESSAASPSAPLSPPRRYDHFRRSFDPVYRNEQSGGGGDVPPERGQHSGVLLGLVRKSHTVFLPLDLSGVQLLVLPFLCVWNRHVARAR